MCVCAQVIRERDLPERFQLLGVMMDEREVSVMLTVYVCVCLLHALLPSVRVLARVRAVAHPVGEFNSVCGCHVCGLQPLDLDACTEWIYWLLFQSEDFEGKSYVRAADIVTKGVTEVSYALFA